MIIRERAIAIAAITISSCALAACQSAMPTPAQLESMQTVSDAYYAYDKGDCETVFRMTDPTALESWDYSEMRYAMVLLNGFCQEIDGHRDQARSVYQGLIGTAPRSFSAQDAQERLSILDMEDQDPEHARWMSEARDRADPTVSPRIPIDRGPAQYPPLARTTGVEGYVIVEFGVDRNGETEEPLIVESNPPYLFDGSSLRAVRAWQFARKPGADTKKRQLIRIVFKRGESTDSPAEPAISDTKGP